MKDEFGNADLDLLSIKLKDNTNFDFSIASSLLANVTNAKILNDNIPVNRNMLWRNIDVKIMKEKKKFNSDVSDMLVIEVLKRKELLIENNTSRDLTFSENKRVAWNDVRALLMSKFSYFDLNVEAIKSHWRYRKRKVTDAYQDLKCADSENMIQNKMSPIDFSIFKMLKESNMLEKNGKNDASTASPSEGEDPMLENFPFERSALSSVSPSSTFLQNQQFSQQQQNQFNFQQQFQQQLNDIIQNSTQHVKNIGILQANNDATLPVNTSSMIERLAAILLIQQQQQRQRIQQQNQQSQQLIEDLTQTQTQVPIHFPLSQRTCSSTPSSIDINDNQVVSMKDVKNPICYEINKRNLSNNNNDENENNVNDKCLSMPFTSNCDSEEIINTVEKFKNYADKNDALSFNTQGTSRTPLIMSNNPITAMSTAAASAISMPHRRKRRAQDLNDAKPEKLFCHNSSSISSSEQSIEKLSSINANRTNETQKLIPDLEAKTLEDYQKMAYIAQRDAFLDLRSIIADVKTSVLPKLMSTLDNLNDNVFAIKNGLKEKNIECFLDASKNKVLGEFRQSINEICDVISHQTENVNAASFDAVANKDVEVNEHESAKEKNCSDTVLSNSFGESQKVDNTLRDIDINNNDSNNDIQVNDVKLTNIF